MRDPNNNFIKSLKIKAAIIGLTFTAAVAGVCANDATERGNTQIEITQTDEENKEEKITLNQLYEELESDRENFVPKTYNNMKLQDKIAAEEKTINDASLIIRAKLSLAITEGTHKICSPNDVLLSFYAFDIDDGFTWNVADTYYTIDDHSPWSKQIGSSVIAKNIDLLMTAQTGRHFNDSSDAVNFTKMDGINEDNEYLIPRRFDMLCYSLLSTKDLGFSFDGNSFNTYDSKNTQLLNYEFSNEQLSCNEGYLTSEQLQKKLNEDLKNFENLSKYNSMTLEEQTQAEKLARNHASLAIRAKIAKAVGCNPEDVYIIKYLPNDDYGFTWKGASHTYTAKGRDCTMPEDLDNAIRYLTWASGISHLGENANITFRYGRNDDPEDAKAIQNVNKKTIQTTQDFANMNLTFDGINFNCDSLDIEHDDGRQW